MNLLYVVCTVCISISGNNMNDIISACKQCVVDGNHCFSDV